MPVRAGFYRESCRESRPHEDHGLDEAERQSSNLWGTQWLGELDLPWLVYMLDHPDIKAFVQLLQEVACLRPAGARWVYKAAKRVKNLSDPDSEREGRVLQLRARKALADSLAKQMKVLDYIPASKHARLSHSVFGFLCLPIQYLLVEQ